jgi:hypothetical protein
MIFTNIDRLVLVWPPFSIPIDILVHAYQAFNIPFKARTFANTSGATHLLLLKSTLCCYGYLLLHKKQFAFLQSYVLAALRGHSAHPHTSKK